MRITHDIWSSLLRRERRSFLLVFFALALAWFALSPTARAQLSPAPDGGYPNANTAEGDGALFSLTTGYQNTAVGAQALQSNTSGSENTGIGGRALISNTTGYENTATGYRALQSNTTGAGNTATGEGALLSDTTGSFNTANGAVALARNTTGNFNTGDGINALLNNTTGSNNTATGAQALGGNTTGNFNTGNGVNALVANTTGINNTASGYAALASNTTGAGNIAIGKQAGVNLTTGSNNIDIGNVGLAGEASAIRIGKQGTQKQTFIAGIAGVAVSGSTVVVNSTGKLGVATSSGRFKEAIKPMDKASEAILGLKPVMFRYKEEIDPDKVAQFGLIAEEVEKVNPDLVGRDDEGKVMSVRYEAVNAMLLNEFLKEHKKVEEQGAMIAQQQKQIEALTATIQKVSDQVALSKPAPQLAANP